MKSCKRIQDSFDEAFYGELATEERSHFESHLADCPQCATAYAETREWLEKLQNYERPKLDDDYWERYWSRLEGSIETKPDHIKTLIDKLKYFSESLFPPLTPVYRPLLTGLALVVIGIIIGRTFLSDHRGVNQALLTDVTPLSEHDIHGYTRAASYFGRAKLVLLGIVNFDADNDRPLRTSFARQVQVSRDLIDEIPVLRKELNPRDDAALLELIAELETVLLQTANLEDSYGVVDVRLIQQGAQRKALLFKIDMGESILSSEIEKRTNRTSRNKPASENEGGKVL